MRRASPRASLIGLALAGGLIAAMLIAFMLTMGGQGAPKAQANFPNTPAGTAKPTPIIPTPVATAWDTGNISGLYDLRAGSLANANAVVYASMYRIEEAADNTVKAAAQTVIEVGVGDVNAEPPGGVALPPHEVDGTVGPPPPPGFSSISPSKSYGAVDANGTLTMYTCAENIGFTPFNPAALGPNLIAKIVIPHFYQQLHNTGKAVAGPTIATGQGLLLLTQKSAAECDSVAAGTFVSPDTSGMTGVPTTFYPANDGDARCSPNCVRAGWRQSGNVLHGYPNWDGDNCTDAQELFSAKPGLGTKGCGDDPWSALDGVAISSADDIAGIYDLQVTLARQDVCKGLTSIQGPCTPNDSIVPGHYITCAAYVQKGMSGSMGVEARLLCSHDSPSEAVNPNYGAGCGTAGHLCADGSPGAAPPGCNNLPATCAAASPDTAHGGTCNFARGYPPFNENPCFDLSDLNTVQWLFPPVGKPSDTYPQPASKQTALTGVISGNTLTLAGCFRDYNGNAVDGNSYWSLKTNVHTGVGVVNIWKNLTPGEQTAGNCGGTPPGSAPGRAADYVMKEVALTRNTADKCTANNAVCEPISIAADCTVGSDAPCGFNTAKWDSDGDGCPDAWELSDVTNVPYRKAGLRDPSNRWDYPDVNHDSLVDIGDISDVVQKYFIDKGETTGGAGGPDALPGGYLIDTDRTGLAGAEDWELNSPDGYVTIDDVVDSVNSYGHTCPPLDSGGNPISLPSPNAG